MTLLMPKIRSINPLLLALGLFALNNLAVLSGWLATPDGYVHLTHVDATDNSIYESWLRSSESRVLHPNFQAPWLTEPAVFKPFLFLVARLSLLAGVSLDWGWLLAHMGLYILTAYALFAALGLFMKTITLRTFPWYYVIKLVRNRFLNFIRIYVRSVLQSD